MEYFAYILDYLPQGRPENKRIHRQPLALAVGEDEFKLFELVPRPGITLSVGERVYIGRDFDKREKIKQVKRRIAYRQLTHVAQSELPYILEEIVKKHERKFVDFFNTVGPITTRMHTLELLPGLGKKTMWEILEARKERPFDSFEDIERRTKHVYRPEKLIVRRILYELQHPREKYKIFVAK